MTRACNQVRTPSPCTHFVGRARPVGCRTSRAGNRFETHFGEKNNSDFTRTEQKRRLRVQVRKWVCERHLDAWSHFLHKKNGSRLWKMRFGMIAFCRFSKVAVPTSAKNGRGVREQLEIVFSLVFLCIQRVKKHRFFENHHFKIDPATSYFLKKNKKKTW